MDGFKKTLREFFYNGCRMRIDVINPIIENLKSLVKRLNMLPSYRFYSSSLLIMYDGAIETEKSDQDEVSWKSKESHLDRASFFIFVSLPFHGTLLPMHGLPPFHLSVGIIVGKTPNISLWLQSYKNGNSGSVIMLCSLSHWCLLYSFDR